MNNEQIKSTVDTLESIGINMMPELVNIKIPNAKENLTRGIAYFCQGQNVNWMKGYDEIVDWLSDNKGRGLMLIGDVGLGKSVIATKVIPILYNHYHQKIIRPYTADEVNEKYKEILSKKLVCLDDVGKEQALNQFGNKKVVFSEIVDNAEKKGDLLVLTTNLTPDELEEKYDNRTLDRLRAITKVVMIEGESNRK